MIKKQVNLIGPVNSLSYGIVTLNIAESLSEQVDVSLFPINEFNIDCPPAKVQIVTKCINNTKNYNSKAPSIRIWHQHNLASHVGSPRIGFPIFELDRFSDMERHHIENVDALFVCSHWAKDVVLNTTSQKNVYVVPLGVDRRIFTPSKITNGPTSFLISGKWEIRKAHDKIAKALYKFKDRNIKVILACDNVFSSPDENNAWVNMFSFLGNKCAVAQRCALQEDYARLYDSIDCLISPSRAEGWNLPVLEAMACGKHVITTNFSAHTEFCNINNARLIEIDSVEPAYDGRFFNGTSGNWAKFENRQIEQLCNHIDNIIVEKESNSLNINQNGIKTAEIFSWNNTSNKIMEAINCLV